MENNQNNKRDILIYQSQNGQIKVEVRFEDETVWLTQQQMAELYQCSRTNVVEHLKHIYEDEELEEQATCRKIRQVQMEGNREVSREFPFYNLDMIISLGYRIKSQTAIQFRIWATQRLREYLVKGFTLNDERLKSGSGYNYFKELLDRIREIRLSERLFYQQVKDIYATSIDYDPSDEMTISFYKEVQNKLLWAISGQTAVELIYYRSNAELPMMGLTSTEKQGKVTKNDALTGKNYLNEEEMHQLKLIVEQFLAYAEMQAVAEKPMYMRDWVQKLGLILTMNEKNILEHAGEISHKLAVSKVTKEYEAYKIKQREIEHLDDIKQLEQDIKRLNKSNERHG
ncbi:virulence RhuM family protein [Alloprevotella tannerae]|jgi:toxin-antitoxin system, toxin component, fic family|uniref:virulence RhuM family protein n=1 Tax=Alloprevotella tannerae TaxID=76122 RepID=UPI0028EDEE3D|nr:virulence RhuM family protein [Alloprevotella tannerae]